MKISLGIFCALTLMFGASADAKSLSKPKHQTAQIKITERGYEPTRLRLRRGIPAKVEFPRTAEYTYATAIVLPDFNIRRELPLNQPVVINFTPSKRGTFTFTCGMNMMRGHLIVQ
jgi:membrane fusion protein, copper/silver efflux system